MVDAVVNKFVTGTATSDFKNVNGLTECKCCVQHQHTLETVLQELSSARKIIQLHEGINSKAVNNVVNTKGNITNREMNHDSRNNSSNEWKLVPANKDRVNRKSLQRQSQPIPTIIKRYRVLNNLQKQTQITSKT